MFRFSRTSGYLGLHQCLARSQYQRTIYSLPTSAILYHTNKVKIMFVSAWLLFRFSWLYLFQTSSKPDLQSGGVVTGPPRHRSFCPCCELSNVSVNHRPNGEVDTLERPCPRPSKMQAGPIKRRLITSCSQTAAQLERYRWVERTTDAEWKRQ